MEDLVEKAILKYFDNFSDLFEIKSGHTNKSFLFTSDQKKYIIRLYAKDLKTPRTKPSINFEINLINLFHQKGIPTPIPLKNIKREYATQINDQFLTVFEYIDGEKVYGKLKPTHFNQVGQIMAQVHQITLEQNLKTDIIWPEGSFFDHVNSFSGYEQDLRSLPQYLIHGDFYFGNLLFKKDKLVGLLDFDHYRMGHFIDDITRFFVAEMAHSEKKEYDLTKDFVDNFWQGYLKFRKLTKMELKLLVVYINLQSINQKRRLEKENLPKIAEFEIQVQQLINWTKACSLLS